MVESVPTVRFIGQLRHKRRGRGAADVVETQFPVEVLRPVGGVRLEPDHVAPLGACRGHGVTYDGSRVSAAALGGKGDHVLDLGDPGAVEIQYPQVAP